jgi:medium-chain acyl-[acyl-carrier-protein] hydrolase
MIISPSLWTPEPAGRRRLRLLCLPYAGGGAGVFIPWAKVLPEEIEVCAVRLPARESRWKEAPCTSVAAIAGQLATDVAPYLADAPYAVFGHSVGSLIGFELLREFRRRGFPLPRLFVAAGRGAPQTPPRAHSIHGLPDDQFLDAMVRRYQAIPRVVLEDKELLQLYLPPLRADMTANETYRHAEEAPLEIPIVAMGGLDDHTVLFEDLAGWRVHTSAAFELEMFPGGHFFLQEQRSHLLSILRRRLAEHYA